MDCLIMQTCDRLGLSKATFASFPKSIQDHFMMTMTKNQDTCEPNDDKGKTGSGHWSDTNALNQNAFSSLKNGQGMVQLASSTSDLENVSPLNPQKLLDISDLFHAKMSTTFRHAQEKEYVPITPLKSQNKKMDNQRKVPYSTVKKSERKDLMNKRRAPRRMALEKEMQKMTLGGSQDQV